MIMKVEGNNFKIIEKQDTIIRHEANQPIFGQAYLIGKQAPS